MVVVVLVMVVVMVVVNFGSVLFCNGDFLCKGCVIGQWDWTAAPWVQDPSIWRALHRTMLAAAHATLASDGSCTHSHYASLSVAKILVRQCACRTKTHNTHSEFLCDGCPSHKNYERVL